MLHAAFLIETPTEAPSEFVNLNLLMSTARNMLIGGVMIALVAEAASAHGQYHLELDVPLPPPFKFTPLPSSYSLPASGW